MMVRITVEACNRVVAEFTLAPSDDGYEIAESITEKTKKRKERIGVARNLLKALAIVAPHVIGRLVHASRS